MTDDHRLPTPQQRLAMSRHALVTQLEGRHRTEDGHESAPHSGQRRQRGLLARFEWTWMARQAGARWWRRHPAHAIGQLALPLLERYAQDQPFKLVAAAAATGAVAVLVRPWRLLSLTAVLAAVFKTSDVADMVNTLMQAQKKNTR